MKTTLLIAVLLSGCAQSLPTEGSLFAAPEVAPDGQELLVNGDFESPAFRGSGWSVFSSIEGWRTSFGPGIEVQNNVAGAPFSGQQHVELDSHASSGMYQDALTQVGASYRLRFAFGARPDAPLSDNLLLVVWNGKVIDELSPQSYGWKTHEYTLTATSEVSRLEFRDASQSDSLGTYLDDVSLQTIGEQMVCR